MNNNKLKNYPNSILKLFFERNNKNVSTFSNLGNVFRNSKWSDLKIQNIKSSFIKQYIITWFIIIIILFTFTTIFVFYNPFLLKSYWLLRLSIYRWFQDLTFSLGITLTTFYYTLKVFLSDKTKKFNSKLFINNIDVPKNSTILNSNIYNNKFNNYSLIIPNMYKLKLDLDLLNNSKMFNSFMLNYNKDKELLSRDFITNVLFYSTLKNKKINNLNQLNSFNTKYDLLNNQKTFNLLLDYITLNPNNINNNTTSNLSNGILFLSTEDLINVIKQDRWLLKNSFISRNLIANNHAILESKKLLKNIESVYNISDKNIWVSNIYSNSNNNLFDSLSIFNTKLINNYNFTEESKEFFTKRYLFLINQQSVSTTQTLNKLGNKLNNFNELYSTNFYLLKGTNHTKLRKNLFLSLNKNNVQTDNTLVNYNYNDSTLYLNSLELCNTNNLNLYSKLYYTQTTNKYQLKTNNTLIVSTY